MGIDKPDVRWVFHASLPANLEAYYQELGRAGSDGRAAEAFMLYGLDDRRPRSLLIEEEESEPEHKSREHKRPDALLQYCETQECSRRALATTEGSRVGKEVGRRRRVREQPDTLEKQKESRTT